MSEWEAYLAEHHTQHLDELFDLLRIPSVSALPGHRDDVQRAAAWIAQRLTTAGLENAQIRPTAGHPVVYADYLHAPGKPTVLIYGHCDVQPADPLSLWTTPPFEPQVRDGRIYARGASDDKGNILAPIQAIEALLQTEGTLPVNLKFFVEGQEEIGSPDVPAFLAAHRDLFACDLVLSADGGQYGDDQPSLVLAARGLAALQIDVRGASQDLHSGTYGGAVANPIQVLARILSTLHDDSGRVAVNGFYDRVVDLSPEDRQAIAAVPFDEAALTARLGIDALPGEQGYTPQERTWIRPTLEINGIWGGFQGEGTKTVLPAEAHAKITCRLVTDQSPTEIARLVADHIDRQRAPGVTVTVQQLPNAANPYMIDAQHWGNVAVASVLERLYGRPPYQTRTGGSIPVCELFQQTLNAPTIFCSFGLSDENLHAPNEFFRLTSFERSHRAYGLVLHALAEHAPG